MTKRLSVMMLLFAIPFATQAGEVPESPGAVVEEHQDQLQSRRRIEQEKRELRGRERPDADELADGETDMPDEQKPESEKEQK